MQGELLVYFCIFLSTGVFAADEMKTEEVCIVQGESETLPSGVEEYHQTIWTSGNRTIATCRGNTDGTRSCEIKDERYRDKLKMDNQTGSLTFINISTDLTGLYQLQIISKSYKTSYKNFNVTVCEAVLETDHTKLKWGLGLGFELGLGLGLGLGLVLLVIVGVVAHCCRRNREQNGGESSAAQMRRVPPAEMKISDTC